MVIGALSGFPVSVPSGSAMIGSPVQLAGQGRRRYPSSCGAAPQFRAVQHIRLWGRSGKGARVRAGGRRRAGCCAAHGCPRGRAIALETALWHSSAMSEPPNLEALARRYLDLWQDQATALAGDAELARQIGQWLSMMQAGMVHGFQQSGAQGT